MSITAYWKATTGFNVNAYPVTLGKSLKLCTATELVAHPMCGSNSPISNISYTVKYSELSSATLGRSAMNLTGGAQFKKPIPNNMANTWTCEPAPTGDLAKVYRRIIFVACPTNVSFPNYCISDNCNENILIVENITAPNKLVASYGNPSYPDEMQTYFNFSVQLRHVCENPHSVWSSAPNQVQYTDVSDPDNPVTKSYYIYPVFIYVVDNNVFLIRDDYIGIFGGLYQNATNEFNMLSGGSSYYNFDTDNDYCLFLGMNVNGTGGETDLVGIFGDVFADPVPNPPVFINSPISYQPTTLLNLNLKFKYSLTHSTISGSARRSNLNITSDGDTSRELRRQQMARAGVYFVENGRIFKPIISGGIVTTYGTAEVPSEIDTYTDLNHPVPSGGGTPPAPSGDDMEAMATGATGSSGGFTHFYVMSPQDLIDFLADFYTRASSGETLTNNLVCSYILGIPSTEFCATEEVPIAIHNSAQGTPFVSQANYSHITATNNLMVVGSFDVPRITNTFYDFAPYSTYEVFIPCCGWVALPDTVAGRRINVEMYIDIASCCLKAAVKTNDLGVCAVTNGVLGAAIPIAVIESGILRGNNIQAGLGIIGGGINTGVGAGSGNAMGIGFGVQQILSGLVECTIAGNTNYTQQKGGTGDITQFAMGHKCYMKVTHPDIDPVVNENIFGHSVGYLCNSIGKLSEYAGFTVCGNPHVTFSASAEEREEIERLLSMGVIL